MRIVIIGAMPQEITFLLDKIGEYKEIKYFNYTFYEGEIFGKNIIVTSSGIGKVASGLLISAIVNYYKEIDLIINVGVSGGILGKVDIADVVIASELKYADVDVTIFPHYQYGQIPSCPKSFKTISNILSTIQLNYPYKVGMIISGDKFYHNKEEVDYLVNKYFRDDNVLCIDMESTALAQGSWFYGINYLAVRAISDLIGSNTQKNQYEKNLEIACVNANLLLLDLLEKI